MLINRSGTMVVPFISLYLTSDEMGYSVSSAGFVFGLFGAGAFAGAWFGGKATDKFGFYPVQFVTLLGGGLMFILLGQMKTYPLICLFTFLTAFINEAFRPANSTAIAFYSSADNRTRSYALNRLAVNLGWAVGSLIGGFLASINYELLFWVDGLTNMSAAVLMWFLIKPVANLSAKPSDGTYMAPAPAHRDKTFIIFIIITGFFAACFFQLFSNVSVHFRNNLKFSEQLIGVLMATNGIIIVFVEMLLVYKLEGRRRSLDYITVGVALVGIAYLFMQINSAPLLMAILLIILITFGEILSMPFMNSYWISRSAENNRGQYAALYTMAWSAAQTLGPMAGAQIADKGSFKMLFWILTAVCLCASFLFHKLKKR